MLGWKSRWMVASAMVIAACSSGADESLAEGGTVSDEEAGDTEVADIDSGDDGVDGSEDDAASDPSAGDTGDESADSGQPNDEGCDSVDCGAGVCVGRADGPACVCEAGYAPLGLECIPCDSKPAGLVELEIVTGTMRVTVGGVVPPTSDYEDAVFELRNPSSGDVVPLGNTHDGELVVAALPGVYEIVYAIDTGGSLFPGNTSAVLETIELVDEVDHEIDLQVTQLVGAIRINGEEPPSTEFEQGRLRLRNPENGDSVLLGSTRYGQYDVLVLPGTYDIHYEHVVGANVPANTDVIIDSVTVDPYLGEPYTRDIDIQMVEIGGDITIGDEAPPSSEFENARLSLLGSLPTDRIPLAETRFGGYAKKVVPGPYRVVYEWVAGAGTVPANAYAELTALDTTVIDGELAIDVPVVTVDGTFSLGADGVLPPADPTDDGNVFLRRGGDSVYLGNTAYGGYERRVIPGDYEVYFGQDSSRGGVPTNTNARILDTTTISAGTMNVLIPATDIEGTITVGGASPPQSDYDDGHIYLRNRETLYSLLLSNTREPNFSASVVPGSYEIVYAAETPGGFVPVNAGAVIGEIDVGNQNAIEIDVPVIQIAGDIAVGGGDPPDSPTDVGQLFLVEARTLDPIYIGSTLQGGGYSQRVTPGDYLVFYRAQASTGAVPANENANLGCWTVQ